MDDTIYCTTKNCPLEELCARKFISFNSHTSNDEFEFVIHEGVVICKHYIDKDD